MKNLLKILYIFLKNKIEKNFDKSNAKKRIKFKKIYEKFNSIKIDTTGYASDLCILGEKYGTDKSIYNKKTKHQHSYTAVYNILFNHLKNKTINIAEIGIAHSSSLQMFRDYFKYSNIYAFDHDKTTIENSKKLNINNVNYFQLDVKDRIEIQRLFKKINIFYDIIIDDSSHLFDHQINIILEAKNFLKENEVSILSFHQSLFLPIDIFSLREMIKIIITKHNFSKNSKTVIDVYELDINQKIISRDGVAVKLTEKELGLILALKSAKGLNKSFLLLIDKSLFA